MTWASRFLELAARCRNPDRTGPVSLEEVLETCGAFGMAPENLRADLLTLAEERLAMWLLGDVPPSRNYLECLEQLGDRITKVAAVAKTPEVAELVELLVETHAGIATNVSARKDGIASVPEPLLTALLVQQGYRCAVCGVPVQARASMPCVRLPSGVEPVFASDLDHVIPFYLGGNSGNLRVLCKPCNQLKSDRLGFQEDAMVIAGNHLRPRGRDSTLKRTTLWTLELAKGCSHSGCAADASRTLLWVRLRQHEAPWVIGNLTVECSEHARTESRWIHEDLC